LTTYSGLWTFLTAWRNIFTRFDVSENGSINLDNFNDALVAFGYRLSARFTKILFDKFAISKNGEFNLSFDRFVLACVSLKRMTDIFKKYDEDRDGYITLAL
jgi:Ca2+-binding EF-hand superfamily protein